MTSALELAAMMLAPDEREAVLGDLAEAGEGHWRGLMDVLGLAIRRQILLWKSWRPWLTAFGLVIPGSFALMGISVAIAWTLRHNLGAQIISGAAPPALTELLSFVCEVFLLLAGAWIAGLVVGSISPRTLWANALLCCAPCLFCLARFRTESLSRLCLLLFLLPAILGVRHGLLRIKIRQRMSIGVAVAVSASMIFLSFASGVWILNWVLLWPAWYLVAAAHKSNYTTG